MKRSYGTAISKGKYRGLSLVKLEAKKLIMAYFHSFFLNGVAALINQLSNGNVAFCRYLIPNYCGIVLKDGLYVLIIIFTL